MLIDLLEERKVVARFPFDGPAGVCLRNMDLDELTPRRFLGDTVVDFCLELIKDHFRIKKPKLAAEIHVFNSGLSSWLYDRQDMTERCSRLPRPQINVNLFKKKFLICPIRIDKHWSLFIVVRPSSMLAPDSPGMLAPQVIVLDGNVCPDAKPTVKKINDFLHQEAISLKLCPKQDLTYTVATTPMQEGMEDGGIYILQCILSFFKDAHRPPEIIDMSRVDLGKADRLLQRREDWRRLIEKRVIPDYNRFLVSKQGEVD